MIDLIAEAISLIVDWQVFIALLVGAIVGLVMGAIPGITGTVAMATSLPICFYLKPIVAIMFLTGTYTGGVMGGSVSAILLNMPGAPGAVATALDGFKLTKQGKHNTALGLTLYSSVTGVFGSYLIMLLTLVPAANIVRYLGPPDRFAIGFTALMIVGSLRGRSMERTLIAALLGVALGTLCPTETGLFRSEFLNLPILYEGLPLVPTLIGLLAYSELLAFLSQQFVVGSLDEQRPTPNIVKILRQFRTWVRHWTTIVFSLMIGFVVGVVPACGATVASLFAYGQAKSWSHHPEKFGQGAEEGLIAAETANNASEGGSMLIMLTLGIPGSGGSALLMSALMMFGLTPGPEWISRNLPFAYALIIANLLLAFGLIFIGAFIMARLASVIYIPVRFLAPALVVIGTAGIFCLRSSVLDVGISWFFAYIGYILKKYDYPPIAVLLGLILAPVMDAEMYRTRIIYEDNLLSVFSSPVVLASLMVSLLLVGNQVFRRRREGT